MVRSGSTPPAGIGPGCEHAADVGHDHPEPEIVAPNGKLNDTPTGPTAAWVPPLATRAVNTDEPPGFNTCAAVNATVASTDAVRSTTGTDTDPPLLFGIVSDAADTCADTDTEPTLPADTDTDTEITGNDPPADTGPADAQLTGHEPEHVHPEPDATICDTGPPADTDTVTGPDADCAPTFDTVTGTTADWPATT